MQINASILDLIGNTPLVKMNRIVPKGSAEVLAKLESYNPGGSVKDRIALAMIDAAEQEGKLRPGGTIIEPTSGNTGIGLAMVSAARGYKLILCMPETMSVERRTLLKMYGADLILTPGEKGMKGAIEKALEICSNNPEFFMPEQFDNPANPEIHRKTTAQEILEQTNRQLDGFVAGIGTGGTITGVGEILREQFPEIIIYAIEPLKSPVLSGGNPGPHRIQGIGAGFVPSVLNTSIFNKVITVDDDDAMAMVSRLAQEEGLLCGISSGAAMVGALQAAKELGSGRTVVVILPDTGERYLSVVQSHL